MQNLSVAIITYNEEAKIAACIESVKDIADEIIVVDSHSTDRTKEIAANHGAKVIEHVFENHISQKNFAMTQCSHSFVLSLDADEQLDQQAIEHIKAQKENSFPHDGYTLKRITHIGDKGIMHGSWYPDKKIRLVKKELCVWKGKGVHESLEVNSTNIFALQGNILHYSYKNVDELFVKTKKYAELAAIYLHQQNKSINSATVFLKAYARFVKHYFLKFGFLSGQLGWQIGKQQYLEAKWKYGKLNQLNKTK